MNISFNNFLSHAYYQIKNKIPLNLSPLQKKIAVVALGYFSCTALILFYHFYSKRQKSPQKKNEKNPLNQRVKINQQKPVEPKAHILAKPLVSKPKTEAPLKTKDSAVLKSKADVPLKDKDKDSVNQKRQSPPPVLDSPGLPVINQANLDSQAIKDPKAVKESSPQPLTKSPLVIQLSGTPVGDFLQDAVKDEDFLSILQCLVDHPEWVKVNTSNTIALLLYFGSNPDFLQPIKVVADLYEKLLYQHSFLTSADNLKTTDVIFEDQSRYRTHLIFALKNLHVIRDMVEDKLTNLPDLKDGMDIELIGSPKTLKAVLQYLDKSNLAAIDDIDLFDLIEIANQYAIPSLLTYCEGTLDKRLPSFPFKGKGDQAWKQTLQLYASMDVDRVNFIIDHLLLQRYKKFKDKENYKQYLNSLSFDGIADKIKARILKRLDAIALNAEVVREEHPDRINNSIDIIEKLASRLSSGKKIVSGYISCTSVSDALKILFKTAIAKQIKDDKLKKRLCDNLTALYSHQDSLKDIKSWRSIEWDADEAERLPSLIVCLTNYLTEEIPQDIKNLPYWHNESLVLAFNDEKMGSKASLSARVIDLAEKTVSEKYQNGCYYLLRPSSTRVSSKNLQIFTVTLNQRRNFKNNVEHFRVEAVLDPDTQQWLFRKPGTTDKGSPLLDFINTKAQGLTVIPVLPKIRERKVNFYV